MNIGKGGAIANRTQVPYARSIDTHCQEDILLVDTEVFSRPNNEKTKPPTRNDPTKAELNARLRLLTEEERCQLESLVLDGVEPSRAFLDKIKPLCS